VTGSGTEWPPSSGAGSPDCAPLWRTSDTCLRRTSIRRATNDLSSALAPASGTPIATPWSPLAGGWDTASLDIAYITMALAPPSSYWVIDSSASYHTTPTTGILSRFHPPNSSHPTSIVVGNDSTLPVTLVGASVLPVPFYLNNVLVAPHITHNLLSVRRFTTDNSCSIEFDLSGFFVKDLTTKTPLTQCDSVGPLYTLRPSTTSTT
jgi:hypothetical protein